MKAAWGIPFLLFPGLAGCLGFGAADPDDLFFRPTTQVSVVDVPGLQFQNASKSDYYFVLLSGSENATLVRGDGPPVSSCSKPWLFSHDAAQKRLLYNSSQVTLDADFLYAVIALDFWGTTITPDGVASGCPTYYSIHGFPKSPFPRLSRVMDNFGVATMTVYLDGSLYFGQDYFVEPGKKLVVTYARERALESATYRVQGGFEIVNLGAWPKSGIEPANAGTVNRGLG